MNRSVVRRQLIGLTAGTLVLAGARAVRAQAWTPGQILGPYYPVGRKPLEGADLTRLPGRAGRATGQIMQVTGRVINTDGKPVPGARIEIWQANTHGRYTHPSDTNPAPLDPNFDGYALLASDAEGRYAFTTIKPGAYPAGPSLMRPPHIHFDVTGRINRLVTQMYFAGEPLNERDPFLQSAGPNKDRLVVALKGEEADGGSRIAIAHWDIVLDKG